MSVWISKMLYFNRTDVTERIDVKKMIESKQYGICQYCYFLNKRFKFQLDVCNGYHNSQMKLSDIAILNIKGADISGISKSEAINVMQNIDLTKKHKNQKT